MKLSYRVKFLLDLPFPGGQLLPLPRCLLGLLQPLLRHLLEALPDPLLQDIVFRQKVRGEIEEVFRIVSAKWAPTKEIESESCILCL